MGICGERREGSFSQLLAPWATVYRPFRRPVGGSRTAPATRREIGNPAPRPRPEAGGSVLRFPTGRKPVGQLA
jgi:hypothetical protein